MLLISRHCRVLDAMYQKFIITDDGVLRLGKVYHHRNLLRRNEGCSFGGGLWRFDEERRVVVLYGRSFEFGPPEFAHLACVDWDSVELAPAPLFYQPHWPYDDTLIFVCE